MLRPQVEEAQALQLRAGRLAVELAEELVAAADGQRYHARLHGLAQRLALHRAQVFRDAPLLAVLRAADEDQVVRLRVQPFDQAQLRHLDVDTARSAAPRQAEDVAAIAVDVHQPRVEVGDAQPSRRRVHQRSSQNGRRLPRLASSSRTSSIAV